MWWTIALLVADSILGSLLMRAQGRAAWRRFTVPLQAGRPPAREVADGVLVIFGGALLLTPGFITDVLGLFFLLPPTRALIRAPLPAPPTADRLGRAPRAGRLRAARPARGGRPAAAMSTAPPSRSTAGASGR